MFIALRAPPTLRSYGAPCFFVTECYKHVAPTEQSMKYKEPRMKYKEPSMKYKEPSISTNIKLQLPVTVGAA